MTKGFARCIRWVLHYVFDTPLTEILTVPHPSAERPLFADAIACFKSTLREPRTDPRSWSMPQLFTSEIFEHGNVTENIDTFQVFQ